MEKQISFKMWMSVFFGGIWQFIRKFFTTIFSWKNKTPFWRVVWATITVCVVFFTCCFGYMFYREIKREYRWVNSERISSNIDFVRYDYEQGPGWITNRSTGEVITRDIDWIKVSVDEDSLAVFSSKGKRGYINRYSGEIAIKPQYDKAWIFSSGVAGVYKDGAVFFIDHSGKPINDNRFTYSPRNQYVYHGDFCVMNNEANLQGVIDKSGNWKIEPKYDWICAETHNYWRIREDNSEEGLWYAANDKGEILNEEGVSEISITPDLGVVYTLPNHLKKVIDFNGNKFEKFLCQDIETLYYDTEQRDSDKNFIPAKCTLLRYRMDDGYEGLCKENGDIVTEPLFWNVQPIGKDLYHCTFRDSGVGVIVNSKGEITNS